jgi:hypothetical protein
MVTPLVTVPLALLLGNGASVGLPEMARHPLHTSVTELSLSADRRAVSLSVRVFADDIALVGDSAAAATYLAERVELRGRRGERIPLTHRGRRAEGELLHLTLGASLPEGPEPVTLAVRILHDRFADQVNLVQVREPGRARTLVFMKGDAPKPLR